AGVTIPPVKYFQIPEFATPKLSPNGKMVAARTRFDDFHYSLSLIDPETGAVRSLVKAEQMSVTSFWWKTDDLLLFLLQEDGGPRTFRVADIKAKKIYDLPNLMHGGLVTLLDPLPGSATDILVTRQQEVIRESPGTMLSFRTIGTNVVRFNIVTAET